MRRIPVVATIRDAYSFTFTHLGGIIGLIWASMVMITIARFFTFNRFYNDFIEYMAGGNAALMGPTLLMMMAYLIASLLIYAVMFVAVAQLALGARSAPAVLHFAFGPTEWRLFRALFAFTGLMMLMALTVLLAVNAIVSFVPGAKADETAMSGVLFLAMSCVGLVLAARFLLLLPAISVSETGPALRRAWALTAGNLWPLIGILIGLFLPLAFIFVLVDLGLGGQAAVGSAATPQLQMMAAVMHARQTLPIACGLSFFVSPLMIGLFTGASVSIWRTLKDEPGLDVVA